jgi:UDP-N-acetylmuramate--alanine ligase
MLKQVDFSGRPFHFIGIGGIGMSALAVILAERGLPVSGSDLRASTITERLEAKGAKLFLGQHAANLDYFQSSASLRSQGLPQVVCSTAISETNPEYQAALELGCPILHRSDVLAALIKNAQSIGVAGTHGKTTTSSLISHILYMAGLDPTVVIGGEVDSLGGNGRCGQGAYLVAEADESDGSLVKHTPWLGVITNIELDHTDHYKSLDQVIQTFQTFTRNCQVTVGCTDCATVREQIQPTITYGLQPEFSPDYLADQVTYHSKGIKARIWERGTVLGWIDLPLLGPHNLANALAAIAVGRQVNLDFAMIAQILVSFKGARRRFEIKGEYGGIRFVDDYAHHPSEIQVTLAAGRQQVHSMAPAAEQHRVIAIFQPHRYSRTETFLSEFAVAFGDADLVVVSDIYSAGEPDLGKVDGQRVADAINSYHPNTYYQPSLQSVAAFLKETLQPGDTALFLGAGNLNRIITDVMEYYQHHHADLSQSVSQA